MKELRREHSTRPVAIWLLIGVGMIMIQVLIGGITRLTGSGLSITEWQPILGALPPMNEASWQASFEKYKTIGQFKQINSDFTLQEFKFIYFWEWFHRDWARLIAVVFAIPFIYFLWKKYFSKEMVKPLLLLFVLGGIVGVLGWIMVQSGLNDENIYVSHIKLAFHFISALGVQSYVLWFALGLLVPPGEKIFNSRLKKLTTSIITVLVVQLIYGAFMAGLKAGVMAPTWPTINGEWWPKGISGDWINNPINVHFIHRGLAYLLTVLLIFWWWEARKINNSRLFNKLKMLPLLLVFVQVLLGIFTVLYAPFPNILLWLGVAHQFTAMLLLGILITMAYLVTGKAFQPAS